MSTIKVFVQAKGRIVSNWLDIELAKDAFLGLLQGDWPGAISLVRDDAVPASLGERYTVRGRQGPDFGIAGTFHEYRNCERDDDPGCSVGHLLCASVLPLGGKRCQIIFGVLPINVMPDSWVDGNPEIWIDPSRRFDTIEVYEEYLAQLRKGFIRDSNLLMHEWLRDLVDEIWHQWPITQIVEDPDEYHVVPSSIRPYEEELLPEADSHEPSSTKSPPSGVGNPQEAVISSRLDRNLAPKRPAPICVPEDWPAPSDGDIGPEDFPTDAEWTDWPEQVSPDDMEREQTKYPSEPQTLESEVASGEMQALQDKDKRYPGTSRVEERPDWPDKVKKARKYHELRAGGDTAKGSATTAGFGSPETAQRTVERMKQLGIPLQEEANSTSGPQKATRKDRM